MPQREQHFFVVANGMANVAVGGVIIRVILLTRSIQEGKKRDTLARIQLHFRYPRNALHLKFYEMEK